VIAAHPITLTFFWQVLGSLPRAVCFYKTPKALANSSPGLVRSNNPGIQAKAKPTLKALGLCETNPPKELDA